MKTVKMKSNQFYDIYDVLINDGTNTFSINFGGNGDLYWNIINNEMNEKKHNSFIIDKENYQLFQLFETLYNDIKNINIFDMNNIPFYHNSYEEYLEEIKIEKAKYRKLNYSNYNELFNDEDNTITWYSDETNHEVANYVIIKNESDRFIIDFHTQTPKKEYDNEYNLFGISIRFRNSGSSYDPFNILFMKMYNNIQKIDDINDLGHQYHIEEYLYKKTKKRTLK